MNDIARKNTGFTLIEILVALVVMLIGMMGAAGLMVRSVQQEVEAYQRLQAMNLLQDMVDRLHANRQVASCYSYGTTGATLGHGAATLVDCTDGSAGQNTRVAADLAAWGTSLLGAAEQDDSANSVGAMVGARGCVQQISATDNNYRITVAWQGMGETAAPSSSNTCGINQFGDEKQRRIVSAIVRVGDLT